MKGMVYLVGAGPGDPELITVRGAECLKCAQVVVYDYLASERLLEWCADSAELVYVGKKGGDHTLSQEKINELVKNKAAEGLVVTRLKGGDPFIFGRGGEEAEILAASGIPFEIVPGVSSAVAAPAFAGIPLTHREYTSSVYLVTGHEDPTKDTSSVNWPALAAAGGTLVFLMGVKNLPAITERLSDHGLPSETPVALVRWGTTPRQQTVTGTLADIVENVTAAGLKAPCIIVIGQVVRLRKTLSWFENRPLFGKTIVVTRARPQASEFLRRLAALGADCLACPTINVVPPDDFSTLDDRIKRLGAYDWLVFTSINGVAWFFNRLFACGLDARHLGGLRTAVIGPATEQRLLGFGVKADIVPESYRAESVAAAFSREEMAGRKVLLPRAAEARPVLPEALREMKAEVDEITAYHTVEDTSAAETLLTALKQKTVDLVTFTSSSTVRNFRKLLPEDVTEKNRLMQDVTLASIGPITSETAAEEGFQVHITAETYTISGLTEAIVNYYSI